MGVTVLLTDKSLCALDEMDKAMKGDYGTQRENREVFGPDYKSRVEICR